VDYFLQGLASWGVNEGSKVKGFKVQRSKSLKFKGAEYLCLPRITCVYILRFIIIIATRLLTADSINLGYNLVIIRIIL